jgi:alpha-ribazole phosphatase
MRKLTRFRLIRHALVAESSRAVLYGTLDVPLCLDRLESDQSLHAALARRLPRPAPERPVHWVVTPLSRTLHTAQALFRAGYPEQHLHVEPGLSEQDLGEWQGITHAALPVQLAQPAHPFWPISGDERPPGGESIEDVIARVGPTLERLAAAHGVDGTGGDVVAVSHGGAIRACIAYAAGLTGQQALHFAIQNLSLSVLERSPEGWRVAGVNEMLG